VILLSARFRHSCHHQLRQVFDYTPRHRDDQGGCTKAAADAAVAAQEHKLLPLIFSSLPLSLDACILIMLCFHQRRPPADVSGS